MRGNAKPSMKKSVLFAALTLLLVAGFWAYQKYKDYLLPNVPKELKETFVHIPTGSSFKEVKELLYKEGFIKDTASFRRVAEKLKYRRPKMRAGRFEIQPGWTNLELVRHLRNGKQAPVKVVITEDARLPEDVAEKVSRFIEPSATEMKAAFQNDSLIQALGFTKETFMSLFIPNTYEFFWNTPPEKFLERMKKEHDRFWKMNDRLGKARKLGLSPEEVYTLASIVERETNRNEEKKRIAGVYLNRLKRGIKLQADPTAVFARRDFGTSRVTHYHTKYDSPYNTYLYEGLPPGPISMASIASIDAVLQAEKHDYIFFCAKGDGSGLHNFAKTLRGHNRNIKKYKQNLKNR